jgi:uncharacterized protein (DUF1697 family)
MAPEVSDEHVGRADAVTRYVALLRGINVGRNKRIPMPDLRTALEAAGYTDVRTLLVSGNVVLTPPDDRGAERIAEDVSAAVSAGWGHDVRVLVRTADEFVAVVDACPVPEPENGSRFMVAFLSGAPAGPVTPPDPDTIGADRWWRRDREIYVWCPNGLLESPAMTYLNGLDLGVDVTVRNWNTVTKLAALASG